MNSTPNTKTKQSTRTHYTHYSCMRHILAIEILCRTFTLTARTSSHYYYYFFSFLFDALFRHWQLMPERTAAGCFDRSSTCTHVSVETAKAIQSRTNAPNRESERLRENGENKSMSAFVSFVLSLWHPASHYNSFVSLPCALVDVIKK